MNNTNLNLVDPTLLEAIKKEWNSFPDKVIVLDDDPTGTQCSNDVYVYTAWDEKQCDEMLQDGKKVSFLLTNSRAFSTEETISFHKTLMKRILQEAKKCKVSIQVFSRSDSTLRWNYPSETETIRECFLEEGISIDGEILCPCFFEGGRITKDNIHYVYKDGNMIPAGESEYAKDRTFAYHSSNLMDYVSEKYGKQIKESEFLVIAQEDLTKQSPEVLNQLLAAKDYVHILVNATNYAELAWFAYMVIQAMKQGKHFLYRGGSSFLRFFMQKPWVPLCDASTFDQHPSPYGGLVVAGSHVPTTTAQLEDVCKNGLVTTVEFDQSVVLHPEKIEEETQRCLKEITKNIQEGKNVLFMTKRKRIDLPNGTAQEQLAFTNAISSTFLSVIPKLTIRPSFLIAKGGITSCQLGQSLMGSFRVYVPGQVLEGIPVWQMEETAVFPGLPFVVFPGNVGGVSAVSTVIGSLMHQK